MTKTNFKNGDVVKLKERFYDEESFKANKREYRTEISKNKGIELIVNYVTNNRVGSFENKGCITIPVDCLELVTPEPDYKFNIGDMVEVIDKGQGYSTYKQWFDDFAPEYVQE